MCKSAVALEMYIIKTLDTFYLTGFRKHKNIITFLGSLYGIHIIPRIVWVYEDRIFWFSQKVPENEQYNNVQNSAMEANNTPWAQCRPARQMGHTWTQMGAESTGFFNANVDIDKNKGQMLHLLTIKDSWVNIIGLFHLICLHNCKLRLLIAPKTYDIYL